MHLPLYGEQGVSLCQTLLQLLVDSRRWGPLSRDEGNGELGQSERINVIGLSTLEIGSGEVVGRSWVYDRDDVAPLMQSTRQLYPVGRGSFHDHQCVRGRDASGLQALL